MAAGTRVHNVGNADGSVLTVQWVLTTADPAGDHVMVPEYADKTFTIGNVAGDAFGGATCSIQGRNGAADTLQTLNKASAGGVAATAAAAAILSVIENPVFICPVLTAVGAGATITVKMVARQNNPLRN